jgi:hypothetical protein
MPGGILLFGVQDGHDGLPPAARSALVAAVDRGCVLTDRRDVHSVSMPVVGSALYPTVMAPPSTMKTSI